MKIAQLLSGISIALTNQEKQFVETHKDRVSLLNLNEQDFWMAQNLVRKGIYSISKDSQTLIKQIDESNN
jgi:hypothetical protein